MLSTTAMSVATLTSCKTDAPMMGLIFEFRGETLSRGPVELRTIMIRKILAYKTREGRVCIFC